MSHAAAPDHLVVSRATVTLQLVPWGLGLKLYDIEYQESIEGAYGTLAEVGEGWLSACEFDLGSSSACSFIVGIVS